MCTVNPRRPLSGMSYKHCNVSHLTDYFVYKQISFLQARSICLTSDHTANFSIVPIDGSGILFNSQPCLSRTLSQRDPVSAGPCLRSTIHRLGQTADAQQMQWSFHKILVSTFGTFVVVTVASVLRSQTP